MLILRAALVAALLLLASSSLSANSISIAFSDTEAPIGSSGSGSGLWTNGGTTGLEWSNVDTHPGLAYGTESGSIDYNDSTAVLSGAWGPNQTAQATVDIVSSDATQFEEVELRLETTITADSITGYEINCSVKPGNPYMQLVRWSGPLGNFTGLDGADVGCVNGDVIKVTDLGGTITAYLNGVPEFSWTDTTYESGSPGIGFYIQNGSASTDPDFGFSSFSATDGLASSPEPSTLTLVTLGAIIFIKRNRKPKILS
jgi:hypothetical protein